MLFALNALKNRGRALFTRDSRTIGQFPLKNLFPALLRKQSKADVVGSLGRHWHLSFAPGVTTTCAAERVGHQGLSHYRGKDVHRG